MSGMHLGELELASLTFRHIADPIKSSEVSGHYHPKVTLMTRGRSLTRKAFLMDETRIIMPAYGTYTGGLRSSNAVLQTLMQPSATANPNRANPARRADAALNPPRPLDIGPIFTADRDTIIVGQDDGYLVRIFAFDPQDCFMRNPVRPVNAIPIDRVHFSDRIDQAHP